MKVDDIITEGPMWDALKNKFRLNPAVNAVRNSNATVRHAAAARSGGTDELNRRIAADNIQGNINRLVKTDVDHLFRKWDKEKYKLPNYNTIQHNPEVYYQELAKWAANTFNPPATIPANIHATPTIEPAGEQAVIRAVSSAHHYNKAAREAGTAPTEPAASRQRGPNGRFTPKAGAPKPAASRQRGSNGRFTPKAGAPKPATTPPTPKAGDPVPRMSGYVYSGEVDARGRPRVKPAAAAPAATTTASSTLPTKGKSRVKAKDIDIDAALKMADTLSPEEKKKLLQDLLKSGVPVKAGGA